MPNTKSAKKRLRQNIQRRAHNRGIKSAVRKQLSKVRQSLLAGDAGAAEAQLRITTKQLDQAAAKGVFHKNMTARVKSRLAKQLHRLQASSAAS